MSTTGVWMRRNIFGDYVSELCFLFSIWRRRHFFALTLSDRLVSFAYCPFTCTKKLCIVYISSYWTIERSKEMSRYHFIHRLRIVIYMFLKCVHDILYIFLNRRNRIKNFVDKMLSDTKTTILVDTLKNNFSFFFF